jgi:hypothetical protein
MSSAVVTALRMVGMMLGLAALTSWALAYFKHLVSTYPSLPSSATSDQFKQWSQGYATHVIASAHATYSAVFFATMVLCLIAVVPAIFLWGNKALEAEEIEEVPTVPPVAEPSLHEAVTLVGTDASENTPPTGDLVVQSGVPPIPPIDATGGNGGKGGRNPKHRRLLIIASIALILLLIAGGVFAAFMLQPDDSTTPASTAAGTTPGPNPADTSTPTVIAGPRMIQLALDKVALTSVFVSQLNLHQGALTDLSVVPTPNDGLILRLNLHIDTHGIHRVMPIELDGVIGVDKQQNLQLHVLHLLRDGQDAGPTAAGQMETAMNELIQTSVMPSLRGQLKGVKLISIHTSKTIACGKGAEMLVLLVQAPPIQDIAAQLTPIPFCFSGPIDLNKLLPH